MERKPSGKYFTALDGVFKKREYIYCLKKKKGKEGWVGWVGGSGEEGGRILLHGEDANTCQIPLVTRGGGPPLSPAHWGGGVKKGGGPWDFWLRPTARIPPPFGGHLVRQHTQSRAAGGVWEAELPQSLNRCQVEAAGSVTPQSASVTQVPA